MSNGNTLILFVAAGGLFGGWASGNADYSILVILLCILLSLMWKNERDINK